MLHYIFVGRFGWLQNTPMWQQRLPRQANPFMRLCYVRHLSRLPCPLRKKVFVFLFPRVSSFKIVPNTAKYTFAALEPQSSWPPAHPARPPSCPPSPPTRLSLLLAALPACLPPARPAWPSRPRLSHLLSPHSNAEV
jgi:hypothetical protein